MTTLRAIRARATSRRWLRRYALPVARKLAHYGVETVYIIMTVVAVCIVILVAFTLSAASRNVDRSIR